MNFAGRIFHLDYDRSHRIFGLDLMRSIGILLVLEAHAYHLIVNYFPEKFLFIPLLDKVAFSFVLSGFLIGSSLVKMYDRDDFGWKPVKTYWIRRWLRTIPTYFVVIVALILLRYTFTHVGFIFPWKHFLFVQNLWKPEADPYYFYPEGWSLSVEEWFYFLVPALVLAGNYVVAPLTGRKTWFVMVAILLLVMSTALRVYKASLTDEMNVYDWNIHFRKIVLLRMDTLMFGVLAAFVRFHFRKFWEQNRKFFFFVFCAGMALTLGLYPFFLKQNYWLKTFYITQVGLLVAMLLPLFDGMRQTSGRWVQICGWLSQISFCIYLLNRTPVLQSMMQLLPPQNVWMAVAEYVLYFAITLAAATLMHKYVERPILQFRERFK